MTNIPYYPSRIESIKYLVRYYNPRPGERILDLGSGDARSLIEFARRYDDIKLYGVEINNSLIDASRRRIKRLGLDTRIEILKGDLFNFNFMGFDTLYTYLTKEAYRRLLPKIINFLESGGRIIAYNISIPKLKPVEIIRIPDLSNHRYLIYDKRNILKLK